MAIGRHWEWRAFGILSQAFTKRFNSDSLPLVYSSPWAEVTDDYLWVPNSRVNVKLRTGIEDGLKFKRIEREDDGVELWTENPKDLYPYKDLNADAFKKLAADLSITLPSIPLGTFDRERTLVLLQSAKPPLKVVRVEKRRQTRRLVGPGWAVKVEVAQISVPQFICSVGVENDGDLGDAATQEQIAAAGSAILSSLNELRLQNERSVVVMSYLDALRTWAAEASI